LGSRFAPPHKRGPVIARYQYCDENGVTLYETQRHDPKTFTQRRRTSAGGWEYKLGDVRRVLYRLPEVIAAVAAGQTVYIVEGEKDADVLAAAGLCATTSVGGAKAWARTVNGGSLTALNGTDVIVWPESAGVLHQVL